MTVVGIICIVLIILIGGFYIHTVNKLGRLNERARNTAGELDTLLWDRNHLLDQLITKAEENGISIPDEHKQPLALSLGMLPTMQMSVYSTLSKRGNAVFELLKEKPGFEASDEIKKLTVRFTNLKLDITDAGKRYNERATEFNSYIQTPLAKFLAGRKGLSEKGHFSLALAEVYS